MSSVWLRLRALHERRRRRSNPISRLTRDGNTLVFIAQLLCCATSRAQVDRADLVAAVVAFRHKAAITRKKHAQSVRQFLEAGHHRMRRMRRGRVRAVLRAC
uniref:Uncharacterized protein n=1 Tax=Plectus sambesii TaxID=2011161 RepID=A0A914VMH8_9BILA